MKKLLVIFICIALYTPTVINIALYTECEWQTITKKNEDCGCTLNTLPHPNEPYNNNNSKQQEQLKLKTDWKFVVGSKFYFSGFKNKNFTSYTLSENYFILSLLLEREIFHPPNFVV